MLATVCNYFFKIYLALLVNDTFHQSKVIIMKVSNIFVVGIVSILCSSSFASAYCDKKENRNKNICKVQIYRSVAGSCGLQGACPQPYHPIKPKVINIVKTPKVIVPTQLKKIVLPANITGTFKK